MFSATATLMKSSQGIFFTEIKTIVSYHETNGKNEPGKARLDKKRALNFHNWCLERTATEKEE